MRNPFAAKPRVYAFEVEPGDSVVLVSDRKLSTPALEYAQKQLDIALAKPGALKRLVLDGGWQLNIIKRKGSNDAAT